MKRSEIIEKVKDFLLNDISRLYPHEDQADEIIKMIEEAGMLPPPTTIFNTDDDNNPIWEPEDEKN